MKSQQSVRLLVVTAVTLIVLTGCVIVPTPAPAPTPWIITVVPTPLPIQPPPAPPTAQLPTGQPPVPNPAAGIQISFTADRLSINQGECTSLQWNVQGGEVMQLDGQPVNRSGQKQVCPQQTTIYSLAVYAGQGPPSPPKDKREVAISVVSSGLLPAPATSGCAVSFDFRADRTTINASEQATLTWTMACPPCTVCAQRVYLDGVEVAGNGSRLVAPTATTTYTARVVKLDGSSEDRQVTIVVKSAAPLPPACSGAPNIASFAANPSTINSGQSATLNWGAVTNATSAVIDQGIGGVPTPGSTTVTPATTTTYTLTATGCGGGVTKQVTVVVGPAVVVLTPIKIPSADLAITDLYADKSPQGTLYGRVTNNGPDSITNLEVTVSCSWARTATGAQLGVIGSSGAKKMTITSLAPGQTTPFNTGVAVDTNGFWYKMTCTLQVPFFNMNTNTANDSYTENIP